MDKARFTINGTPSQDGNGDRFFAATPSQVLTCTLEANPSDVLSVRFDIYDPTDPESPLASKSAPNLVWNENTQPSILLSAVNGSATVTMPSSGVHTYLIRCTVSTPNGPEVFERIVAIFNTTTAPNIRKTVPAESIEARARAFSDDLNDYVDVIGSFATGAVASVFGRTGAVVAVAGDYDAVQVDYDNGTSGLTATDVQAAIDELAGAAGISNLQEAYEGGNTISATAAEGAVILNAADAVSPLTVQDGGVNVLVVDSAGAVTVTPLTSQDFTVTTTSEGGDIRLNAAAQMDIDGGTVLIDSSGNLRLDSAGVESDITMSAADGGVVTIEAGADAATLYLSAGSNDDGALAISVPYPLVNANYAADAAMATGFVFVVDPTTTTDTVNSAYTAGVAATSNPSVGTVGASTFSVGDLILIRGVNRGIYEVLSHASNVLTIRGVGTTDTVESFTKRQFVPRANDTAGITKVAVGVARFGADGAFETGYGSATPLAFVDVAGNLDTLVNQANVIGAPTYSTVADVKHTLGSVSVISGGAITDDADGTITVAAGTGYIRASDSDTAPLLSFDWTVGDINPTGDALSYIYVEYNGGSPQVVSTTTKRTDYNTNILLGTVYKYAPTTIHITDHRTFSPQHIEVDDRRLVEVERVAWVSGAVVTHVGTRNVQISEGNFWHALHELTLLAGGFDSSVSDTFSYFYRDGVGGWTEVVAQTQISNSQYDDGSGTLASLSTNRYGVHWLYLGIDDDVYVIYGRGDYTGQGAQDAAPPGDVPPHFLPTHATLAAKIVAQQGASNFTSVESAFDTKFPGLKLLSLQTAYEGGAVVSTSAAEGTVVINATDTQAPLSVQDGGVEVFGVDGNGAVNVDPMSGQDFTVTTLGAGDIRMNAATHLDLDSALISIDSTGNLTLSGAGLVGITASGSQNALLLNSGGGGVVANAAVDGAFIFLNAGGTTEKDGAFLIGNRYPILNATYTADAALDGGIVVVQDPTTTVDTVNGSYVAGVAATSNPTVVTTGSATFAAGDIILFSTGRNVGLYEVLSHTGTTLTIKGVGTTNTVETFTNRQFIAGASDAAAITKVSVSVIRCGTDGVFETGKGSATPITFTDIGSGGGGEVDPTINGLRLTAATGAPVPTSDVSAGGTVYWTPDKSDAVALYNGTDAWGLFHTSELSYALSGHTAGTPFDVFAYDNGGTVTLEVTNWSSATARATALVRQDGVLVRSGATTRRYLGTVRPRSATTFDWITDSDKETSSVRLDIWNVDNQVDVGFFLSDTEDSHTYSTATVRQWDANTAAQIELVCGIQRGFFRGTVMGHSSDTSSAQNKSVGFGYDSTTAYHARSTISNNADSATARYPHIATITHQTEIGVHYYAWLQYSASVGTTTWYGDNAGGTTHTLSGMSGTWTC